MEKSFATTQMPLNSEVHQQKLVEVVNLTKRYAGNPAVSDLSFSLDSGSILGLVGPNGAGKTTTLRMLSGIVKPTGGLIRIDGFDTVKQPMVTKRITGYVPDEPHLFRSLTVWEHIEFTASVYGLKEYSAYAEKLLDQFQLDTRRNSVVQELSLGMRQKVAICCMYLTRPRLLLFDEPLTGLDPMGIREMSESIASFSRTGSAVIISSHLLGLVEDLCTEIMLLREGQCVLSGSLDVVLNRISSEPGNQSESLESLFFRTISDEQESDC